MLNENNSNTFWDIEESSFEKKKIIRNSHIQNFSNIISSRFCDQFPYSQSIVHSVYISDPFLEDINDKLNSSPIKNKIRLRAYDDAKVYWLEEKSFIYGRRLKKRKKIFQPLNFKNMSALSIGPFRHAVPTIHLSYHRRRFIDKRTNTKINIDTNIQVVSANKVLFPFETSLFFDLSVIEFKSENLLGLDSLVKSMGINNIDGFSKYVLGIQQINNKHHRIGYDSVNEFLSTDGY